MHGKELDAILWAHLSELPYFRGMLRAVEHSFYVELNLARPMLDIGAGDGHFASVVFKQPVEVGLDPWWEPLREADRRGAYYLLTQANGDAIPFERASFETVISNSVLEHIPEIDPVLRDIARVLKPGGQFVFSVPNQHFKMDLWGQGILLSLRLRSLSESYNRFFNRVARHMHLDAPEVWIGRLNQAGFEVTQYWDYFPIKALHMLERGHLFGLHSLFWKKTIGRWVLVRKRWNPFIPWRKIRPLLDAPVCTDGVCTFYLVRKVS